MEEPLSPQDLQNLPPFLTLVMSVVKELEAEDAEDEAELCYSKAGGHLDMQDIQQCVKEIRGTLAAFEAAVRSA